jgi:hypothetical protein
MAEQPNSMQGGEEKIPYKVIAEALQSGKVVPFLGAGASAAHRPPGAAWAPGAYFCPRGNELANYLAKEAMFPDETGTDDLMLVASYFEAEPADRPTLQSKLDKIFCDGRLRPGPIHRLLAACPNLRLIMTTNYDSLLEQAFKNKIHVVVDHGQEEWVNVRFRGDKIFSSRRKKELGRLLREQSPVPTVFKLHGAAYKDDFEEEEKDPELRRFVLTADDYVRVLEKQINSMPAYFNTVLESCDSFLFLGYGLADWNVRVMLSKIRRMAADAWRRSWAIQHNPLKSERKIWGNRGVNLYHCDLGEFVKAISQELGLAEVLGYTAQPPQIGTQNLAKSRRKPFPLRPRQVR